MSFDRHTKRRAFLQFKREETIQNYLKHQTDSINFSRIMFWLFKNDMERIDRMLKILE